MTECEIKVPENTLISHSSTNGTYQNYQDNLTNRYLEVIATLEANVNKKSAEIQKAIDQHLSEYKNIEKEKNDSLDNILNSMDSASLDFDTLKSKIVALGDELVSASIKLDENVTELYSKSYMVIEKFIKRANDSCSVYYPQIGPEFSQRLPFQVENIKKSYTETQVALKKILLHYKQSASKFADNAKDLFDKSTDNWRTNRFQKLKEDMKARLEMVNPDCGTLFEDFASEQTMFTSCFQKILQDLTIIIPPTHFTRDDFNLWWHKSEECLISHANFIDVYVNKITNLLNEKTSKNGELMANLEVELTELKGEAEASNAILELTPLYKQSSKICQVFIEKLSKYWEDRRNLLRNNFDSIKLFISSLLDSYSKFTEDVDNAYKNVEESVDSANKESSRNVEKLEQDFTNVINLIQNSASSLDIEKKVIEGKKVLLDIETEYRNHYNKIIGIYDSQPEIFNEFFIDTENELVEKLKLRKTANSPDFDLIVQVSSRSSRKTSLRSTAQRNQRKPNRIKINAGDDVQFQMTTRTGAKFEEIETLVVIPPFGEYVEESPRQNGKKGAKKITPRKPPPKKTIKGVKGRKDELDELEISEMSILTYVPVLNDKPIISIFIPSNDLIATWLNELRQAVIEQVNDDYLGIIQKTKFVQERDQLADALNEKMRIHAPRCMDLEINIAKNRILRINSRRIQLEKFFHNSAHSFNKSLISIEQQIKEFEQDLSARAEEFKSYLDKLALVKNPQNFIELETSFKISEKSFLKYVEEAKNNQIQSFLSFIEGFNNANDRFIDVVINSEDYSQDERDNAMIYFDKMRQQLKVISDAMIDKINAAEHASVSIYQDYADELQQTLPKHQNDVNFIESLKTAQNQAKSKYDALIFRNKYQEDDINRLLDELVRSHECTYETKELAIIAQADAIEKLRMELVQRAKYLSLLKSDISDESVPFNIDLSKPADFDEILQREIEKKKKKEVKPKPVPQKKISSKKGASLIAEDDINTISGQIDFVGSTLVQTVTKLSSDYYSRLKATKSSITRVDQIKPTLNECVQSAKQVWSEQTKDRTQIIDNSSLVFRTQVMRSMSLVRLSLNAIYNNFNEYFSTKVNDEQTKLKEDLETELKDYANQSIEHKNKLTPKIADPNNIQHLRRLIEKERERFENERNCVSTFATNFVDVTKSLMIQFSTHIPVLTSNLMAIFDKFPIIDDLVPGPILNADRKTLNELLQDRERKVQPGTEELSRCFRIRTWNQLAVIMKPLESFTIPSPPAPKDFEPFLTPTNQSPKSQNEGRKNSKSKKDKDCTKVEVNLDTETPVITSLDTSLHRTIVSEQNRIYGVFQDNLKLQLDEFTGYLDKIYKNQNKFIEYWQKSVCAVAPDAIPKRSLSAATPL